MRESRTSPTREAEPRGARPLVSEAGSASTSFALGAAMSQTRWADGPWPNRYRMVVLAVVLLELVGIVPGLGGLLLMIASQLEAGALIARRWSERKRRPMSAAVPMTAAAH
jgi:hypothetical protein